MKKINLPFSILLSILFLFTACEDKEETIIVCSFGMITTVQYTLTPLAGGTPIVLSFVDMDGEGGGAYEIC